MEDALLTFYSTQHSASLEFVLLFLQVFMNMPPYFDLLFLVILDYSFEVGFFALFVLVDLLVYSLGQINLFMHFRFLLYAACMYGPNS